MLTLRDLHLSNRLPQHHFDKSPTLNSVQIILRHLKTLQLGSCNAINSELCVYELLKL